MGVLVAVWAAAAVVLFVLPRGDRPVHAGAIVVLAGSKARLPVGVKLLREGYAPLLVVSRNPRPNALERGLCPSTSGRVICFRARPYSTRGEARFIGALARSRGLRSIDVVTSRFHLFRARILIRRCYDGALHMVGVSDTTWRLPLEIVSESAKLAYQELVARDC